LLVSSSSEPGNVVCDHLQLIKFWPSRALGKWVCGGAKFLALPYTTASAQCLRLLWAPFSFVAAAGETDFLFLLVFHSNCSSILYRFGDKW